MCIHAWYLPGIHILNSTFHVWTYTFSTTFIWTISRHPAIINSVLSVSQLESHAPASLIPLPTFNPSSETHTPEIRLPITVHYLTRGSCFIMWRQGRLTPEVCSGGSGLCVWKSFCVSVLPLRCLCATVDYCKSLDTTWLCVLLCFIKTQVLSSVIWFIALVYLLSSALNEIKK